MNATDGRFDDYLSALKSRVIDEAKEVAEDRDAVAPTGFREQVFTDVILASLEDLGQVADVDSCFFEKRVGRGTGKVNAWAVDEASGQATLVATVYRGLDSPGRVSKTELKQSIERAIRVFEGAGNGFHSQMEPASPAFDMMQRMSDLSASIDRVRVVVLVDGYAADPGEPPDGPPGLEVQTDIWDLRRLFRAHASGLPYEPLEIDVVERLGHPLPCVDMPESSADYDAYLAIIPGDLLHDLYHEYGARLLELNVRSFLQARGKVNKGIRNTLKGEPTRFLAYNNGISATAEWVETTKLESGMAISKIRGLQVVNGGQTVASIHRARDRDKLDLSEVFVQAKLSIVSPEQIETLVPLISRYANTQNRVNEADFSANHPFHVKLQQLSQTIWAPGEQNRWFYERARGQYQVAEQRDGTTKARLAKFKKANPASQRFDKVKLAKYVNAWDELPHTVSKGGQKNFVAFMQRLVKHHDDNWEPDADYFQNAVAKAIIFKRAESIARAHKFTGYRANAIAYTVALVAYRTAGRVNLAKIWREQGISQALEDTIFNWMPEIHGALIESAPGNVTEWCKKEACWRHLQTLELEVSEELEGELSAGQALPLPKARSGKTKHRLNPADRENIARVMQVRAEEWVHISGWGAKAGTLEAWQVGIATTLASYAAAGWQHVPSHKQANQGVKILAMADQLGGRAGPETDVL